MLEPATEYPIERIGEVTPGDGVLIWSTGMYQPDYAVMFVIIPATKTANDFIASFVPSVDSATYKPLAYLTIRTAHVPMWGIKGE